MIEPVFHIEEVQVADPKIWPTNPLKQVRRFALVDQRGVVWINGHTFGFLLSMMHDDRSTQDCRHLLRESPEEAWRDQSNWYHFEKDAKTGNYISVYHGVRT